MRPIGSRRSTSARNASSASIGRGQRRLDERRRDRVDRDPSRRPLDGERPNESVHRVLARAVRRTARITDLAHLRRDRDDASAASRGGDARREGAAGQVGAAQVRVDDEVEVGCRLLERRPGAVQACSSDADRGHAVSSRRLDETLDVVRRANVANAELARRPRSCTSLATATSSDSVRAKSVTSAPASASASAAARPMPRPAPVTIACCPSSLWVGRTLMSPARAERGEPDVSAIPPLDQDLRLLRRQTEEAAPGLDAELAAVDVLAQERGRRERIAESALEGVVDVRVHVQASQVGDRERAEERQPEAERRAHDLVDLLRRRETVLDDLGGLLEERELDAVGDEAGPSPTTTATLPRRSSTATTRSTTSSAVAGVAITSTQGTSSGGTNQCTPRNRSGPRSPAASSAIGIDDVFVAITASSAAAASIDLVDGGLGVGTLDDRLDDEIGAGDRVRNRRRCGEMFVGGRRRAGRDDACLFEARQELDRAAACGLESSGVVSTSTVATPLAAKTCAIPTPIVPAPTIATRLGQLTATPGAVARAPPRRRPSANRRAAAAGRVRRARAPRGRPRRIRMRRAASARRRPRSDA